MRKQNVYAGASVKIIEFQCPGCGRVKQQIEKQGDNMYQVQWGYKGNWNQKEFDQKPIATEFWRQMVFNFDGSVKVLLIEKNTDEDPHTIVAESGRQ